MDMSLNSNATIGKVFNIERYHINDGRGIRTVIFLKGCEMSCPWCCNPESQSSKSELAVHKNLCTMCLACEKSCPQKAISHDEAGLFLNKDVCILCGLCVSVCPVQARQIFGKEMSVEQVMAEVEKDAAFYLRSGGGVTLSGGEPGLQPRFSNQILKKCKQRGYGTAVETNGAVAWDSLWQTTMYADEILLDIKFTTGVLFKTISLFSFDALKGNIKKLTEKGKRVIFRCPIIPGYNDNDEHIANIVEWGKEFGISRVDVMAFHQLGSYKYDSLSMNYTLKGLEPPGEDTIRRIVEKIRSNGFIVTVGG